MKTIIIKPRVVLPYEDLETLEKKCKKGVKDGLLVLPCWCDVFVVDEIENTEVKS